MSLERSSELHPLSNALVTMSKRSPSAALKMYFDAVNRHDVEAALAHLSSDFKLRFIGGPELTKDALRSALGWDAGTGGRLSWAVVSEEGNRVIVDGEESNAFLELLGTGPLRFRSEFHVDSDGLIDRQSYEILGAGPDYEEALRPVIAWARQAAPNELAAIYPDGQIVYSEQDGRRWVALLRRWKAETAAT